MKDFIGQTIQVGDFIAKGGKGNVKAEYGMICYVVLAIKNNKLSVCRLDIRYPAGKAPGVVSVAKSTISNPNAVIVFSPTKEIKDLFTAAQNNSLTTNDKMLIGNWIHGAEHQKPWG